ncbi:TRAP transporter small permease subunit [Gammaproteobacteria bacterium]|nr:TRAP transporter small permease subunit [Gammaproteobacteria bacterium]
MISLITRLADIINTVTETIGRLTSWLTVAMVATVLAVVVTRYFLQIGSIALQESVTYLHCMVFMLGLAYTLKHDGHVRVDIIYRGYSGKTKALVNVVGGVLFLLPLCCVLFYVSWDYVLASWATKETSAENNGLPFTYLLKSLMLMMPVLLFLQGLAETVKNGLILSSGDSTLLSADDSERPIL